MSTFNAQITVANKSSAQLTLNPQESSGIDTNAWPTVIDAGQTIGPFAQGFDFQIKFSAVFDSGNASISLYMYGDGAEVFSVSISQTPSNPQPFPGSTSDSSNPRSATFTIED